MPEVASENEYYPEALARLMTLDIINHAYPERKDDQYFSKYLEIYAACWKLVRTGQI